MNQIKTFIIIVLLLSIAITLYCFTPTRITPKEKLSEDDIKIKVGLISIFGTQKVKFF